MKFITVIFLISLTIVSCKTSTNSPVSSDLIPLNTGNTWVYQLTTTDKLGNVRSNRMDTSTVGFPVSIQGSSWFLLSGSGGFSPSITGLLANRSDGVWGLDEQSQRSFLLFRYPVTSGSEYTVWTDSTTFSSDGTIIQFNVKVVSTSENISGVKQSFLCYHYQPVSHSINTKTGVIESISVSDIYVAPGIGIIKNIDKSTDNMITTTLLQDYSLK